jgi:hypothetical protein
MGKTKTISSKVRNNERYPLSPLLLNTVLEFLVGAIMQENEIKGIQIKRKNSNYPYLQMI